MIHAMGKRAHWKGIALAAVALLLGACSNSQLVPLDYYLRANQVTLQILNYCPVPGRMKTDFFAVNLAYVLRGGRLLPDSDYDGVPDVDDSNTNLGLSPNNPDSTGLGFGDRYIFLFQIAVNQENFLPGCENKGEDSDSDGIPDCTERLLHTDPSNFDSDGDGIPDGLEFRFGLNPLDPGDAILDSGSDGWTNLRRVHAGLPIGETIGQAYQKVALQYSQSTDSETSAGCLNYTVSQIPIASNANGDPIDLYFIEEDNQGVRYLRHGQVNLPGNAPDKGLYQREFADLKI
jgi:hypothetical protein